VHLNFFDLLYSVEKFMGILLIHFQKLAIKIGNGIFFLLQNYLQIVKILTNFVEINFKIL